MRTGGNELGLGRSQETERQFSLMESKRREEEPRDDKRRQHRATLDEGQCMQMHAGMIWAVMWADGQVYGHPVLALMRGGHEALSAVRMLCR